MKFHNTTLTEEQQQVLIEAATVHNVIAKAKEPKHIDLSPEDYLDKLILTQIEGLIPANATYKSLLEQEREKINNTRSRMGLNRLPDA